jgi:transposase
VVVLDNLSVDKDPVIDEWLAARGCDKFFLPPYPPDFNPIEPILSKIKATLQEIATRSTDALDRAITHAIGKVTSADAANCFEHCGYLPMPSPN